MKSCQILTASLLIMLFTATELMAQASMTRGGGAPSTADIAQNFITMQQAAIARQLRQVQSCISLARENLRDVQGNINRVAQTDLLNCQRRLGELLRAQANLRRQSARTAQDAAAQAEMAQDLRKQQQQRSSSQSSM